MKRALVYCTLLLCSLHLMAAEDVSFQASAPKQVVEGQPFQITYTLNKRGGKIQAPEFVDFDFLAGPYESQSTSSTFVNGQFSSSFQHQFTYTLMPTKQGTFTLGPAVIKVDGKQVSSNGLRITVLPPDQTSAQSSGTGGNTRTTTQQRNTASGAQAQSSGNGDIFIRTVVSKTQLYEQEVLTLSYKLYVTGMDVRGFTEKTQLPEFTGFLKTELEQKDIQFELEHYNNRNYQVATIFQTLLYPQHSGDIVIEPASFEAVILLPNNHRRSFFDDAFIQATRPLKTKPTTIHVDALPAGKPAGYSGGVGHFTLSHSISGTELQTNDAVTLTIEIEGAGNMKLLKTPNIDWPEGFEPYDPKVTNNFRTTSTGVSGKKTIEYLAIARNSGDYTIPALQVAYFDTKERQYRTLSTPEYTLHVHKGANDAVGNAQTTVTTFTQKEDIKQLGTDIRYIHTTPLPEQQTEPLVVFGTLGFWLCYLIPLLLTLLGLALGSRYIRENADMRKVRYRKANRVAQKRLKQADILLSQGNKEQFYEEIEHASFSYLSDRLSIPTADLSKDNIADILRRKQVDETLIAQVHDVLSTAEFARYAPSTGEEMSQLYQRTAELINQLESHKL